MKNDAASVWDEYFSLRNIDEKLYKNEKLKKYFVKILPAHKTARICDIGCGFGQTLGSLTRAGYVNLVGIEPSSAAARYCTSQGLNVINLDVKRAISAGIGKFDFVFMLHVLEHVDKAEVVPLLSLIREELLVPEGRLFIAVPNAQSNTGPYWRYEDWTHETLFTSGSLEYVVRKSGYTSVILHDVDCLIDTKTIYKIPKKLLLYIYQIRYKFWNWVTASSTHKGSVNVFSYEIKILATK